MTWLANQISFPPADKLFSRQLHSSVQGKPGDLAEWFYRVSHRFTGGRYDDNNETQTRIPPKNKEPVPSGTGKAWKSEAEADFPYLDQLIHESI